jgi:outer membrane protein OmpA-like peptidoglycan-associated protein
MMRLAPVSVLMLLAACSTEPGDGAAAPGSGNMSSPVTTPTPVAGAATVAPAQNSAGTGLRANVSDLTGNISGLNTRVTDMGLIIDLPSDALFDFDKAALTADAEAQLRKAADVIRQSPPGALRIIGHTDDRGDDAYNRRLSAARAETVAAWLKQQVGVRTRAFDVSGKGESEPIAPNSRPDGSDDPAGRAKNRRVEIVIPRQSS